MTECTGDPIQHPHSVCLNQTCSGSSPWLPGYETRHYRAWLRLDGFQLDVLWSPSEVDTLFASGGEVADVLQTTSLSRRSVTSAGGSTCSSHRPMPPLRPSPRLPSKPFKTTIEEHGPSELGTRLFVCG